MNSNSFEKQTDTLERVVSEVRRLLPAHRYGLRESIENGLIDPIYEEKLGREAKFSATANIGCPPNVISYECLTGSIIAHDIFQKNGIETQYANAGPKESKFLFENDVVLILPGGNIYRVVPLYPAVDKPKLGEKYKIGNVSKAKMTASQQGLHRFEIAQDDTGFPLSGFIKMGTFIVTGVGFNYATENNIYLIHQTLIGKGSRLLKKIRIVIDIPKTSDFSQAEPNLESMMRMGLGLPAYLEEGGFFFKDDLRTLKRIEIQESSDVSGKIKATRLESFMRDSKALCQIAKAISLASKMIVS